MGILLPSGVRLRPFFAPDETREEIYSRVLGAYSKKFPIENDRVRLELDNLSLDENKKKPSLQDYHDAIMQDRRLSVPMRGRFRLFDKMSGRLLDEKEQLVANVPAMTHRSTFIVNGTEYATNTQQRLRAGVFARQKENGELESHCFHRTVRVWTEHGLMTIGKIVSQKLKIKVWSYDFQLQAFVLRPIIGWFKNRVDGLGCASFKSEGRLATQFRSHPSTLWSTSTHQIFTRNGGKVEIEKAKELLIAEEQMSPSQEQVILGSILGDGHITDAGLFQEAHCVAQSEYLLFKAQVLGGIVSNIQPFAPKEEDKDLGRKKNTGGLFLSTKACSFFRNLRKETYNDNREKIITDSFLSKIDERGLAIWFCDDGCSYYCKSKGRTGTPCQTNHLTVTISSQGFQADCIERIIAWLKTRWGIVAKKDRRKADAGRNIGWFLKISGGEAKKFISLVAPFIHASVQYKLPKRPITGACQACGLEIKRNMNHCNRCCLENYKSSSMVGGDYGKRNIAKARFGGLSNVLKAIGSNEIPADCNPGKEWDIFSKTIGIGIEAMSQDNQTKLALASTAFEFHSKRGFVLEGAKTAYDIEVEGTHNYFANGVLVSNCNTRSGTGPQLRLYMEPDTGVYRVSVQNSNIKLYPILKATGISDEELSKQWGPDILAANQKAYDKVAVNKFYTKLLGSKADPNLDDAARGKAILQRMSTMELDGPVVERALGKPYDRVSPQVLVDGSAKLLKVHRGEAEQDDRDSLANKRFLGVEDFLEERIAKDAGKIGRTLLYRAGYDLNLRYLKPGHFTPQLEELIVGNAMSQPVSGINPLEVFDQNHRVVQTGEGGVSKDAVPGSSRNVHASQFGFIDPIRTSDSGAVGIDQRYAKAAMKGSDGNIYAPFRNRKTGAIEWMSPDQVATKSIGFAKARSLGQIKYRSDMTMTDEEQAALATTPQVTPQVEPIKAENPNPFEMMDATAKPNYFLEEKLRARGREKLAKNPRALEDHLAAQEAPSPSEMLG